MNQMAGPPSPAQRPGTGAGLAPHPPPGPLTGSEGPWGGTRGPWKQPGGRSLRPRAAPQPACGGRRLRHCGWAWAASRLRRPEAGGKGPGRGPALQREAEGTRLLFPPRGLGAAAVAAVGGWPGLVRDGPRVLPGRRPGLLLPGRRGGPRGSGPQQGLQDPDGPHGQGEPPEQGGGLQGRQLLPDPVEGPGRGAAGAAGPARALVLPAGLRGSPRVALASAPARLAPSYLEAELLEQRVQRRVPQGHGGEELLHPLASPPLAAPGRDGALRRRGGAPGPAPAPAPRVPRPYPCAPGCENQYL